MHTLDYVFQFCARKLQDRFGRESKRVLNVVGQIFEAEGKTEDAEKVHHALIAKDPMFTVRESISDHSAFSLTPLTPQHCFSLLLSICFAC